MHTVELTSGPDVGIRDIADLFCGGGGSGHGILEAFDRFKEATGTFNHVRGTFVNHSEHAIATHTANHPEPHRHVCDDLYDVDPMELFPEEQALPFLWASPSCVGFSVAKGSVPVNDQERSHAHCVIRWVSAKRPEVVLVENVKEFRQWGPLKQRRKGGRRVWVRLDEDGKPGREYVSPAPVPQRRGEHWRDYRRRLEVDHDLGAVLEPDKRRAGEYFRKWIRRLASLGYRVEHRILMSADYGDPTRRRRLFIYAVKEGIGKRIVWPKPTHASSEELARVPSLTLKRWRVTADIVDWSDEGTSIFTRERPLSEKTMRRIAIGFCKYGLAPYVIPKDRGWDGNLVRGVDEPASVITTTHRGEGLARPYLIQYQGQSIGSDVDAPTPSLTTMQKQYLVNPMLIKLRGNCNGRPVDAPLDTVTGGGFHHALTTAIMGAVGYGGLATEEVASLPNKELWDAVASGRGDLHPAEAYMTSTAHRDASERAAACRVKPITDALATVNGNRGDVALVRPWIYTYYSSGSEGQYIDEPAPTITAKARLGLCYPAVEFDGKFYVVDILFRMLTPRELARAMGFPDDYVFPGTKTQQVRAIGNSVSCGLARALTLAWLFQDEDVSKFD